MPANRLRSQPGTVGTSRRDYDDFTRAAKPVEYGLHVGFADGNTADEAGLHCQYRDGRLASLPMPHIARRSVLRDRNCRQLSGLAGRHPLRPLDFEPDWIEGRLGVEVGRVGWLS